MAANELRRDRGNDIRKVEPPLLAGELRVEDHLKQQVPKLAGQVVDGATLDRIGHFVRFLDRVRRDARERLRAVPSATSEGVPERRHDLE